MPGHLPEVDSDCAQRPTPDEPAASNSALLSGEKRKSDSAGGQLELDTRNDDVDDISTPIDVTSTEVYCENLETTCFNTWDEFTNTILDYSARTFQPFRIRDTVTIENINNKARLRCTSGNPRILPTICGPVHKPIFSRTLVCTHSGTPRYRGKKKKKTEYRSCGCPAFMTARIKKLFVADGCDDGVYRVVMTKNNFTHNHAVNPSIFRLYSDSHNEVSSTLLRPPKVQQEHSIGTDTAGTENEWSAVAARLMESMRGLSGDKYQHCITALGNFISIVEAGSIPYVGGDRERHGDRLAETENVRAQNLPDSAQNVGAENIHPGGIAVQVILPEEANEDDYSKVGDTGRSRGENSVQIGTTVNLPISGNNTQAGSRPAPEGDDSSSDNFAIGDDIDDDVQLESRVNSLTVMELASLVLSGMGSESKKTLKMINDYPIRTNNMEFYAIFAAFKPSNSISECRYLLSRKLLRECDAEVAKIAGDADSDNSNLCVSISGTDICADDLNFMKTIYEMQHLLEGKHDTFAWLGECSLKVGSENVDPKLQDFIQMTDPRTNVAPLGVTMSVSHLYAFKRDAWFNDRCIDIIGTQLKQKGDYKIAFISPVIMDLPLLDRLRSLYTGNYSRLDIEKLAAVVSYGNMHWCAILMDLRKNKSKRILFDPLQRRSTYRSLATTCKETFAPLFPRVFANLTEENFMDVKLSDEANCGVYVLEFIRSFFKDTAMEEIVAEKLELFRLRYFADSVKHI